MSKSGTYKIIRVNGKPKSEHKHVWELHHGPRPDGMTIHHINGNPRDNRIENLRLVTNAENKAMSSFGTISKQGNRYRARRNGKWLGAFRTMGGAKMALATAYL